MHLLEQKTIGILLLALMALLVSVKQLSTGSTIEMPTSGPSLLRIGNGFNLFFLLVVNPLAAIQLFTGSRVAGAASSSMDSSAAVVTVPWVLQTLEIAGLLLTVTGYLFMDWALICLGRMLATVMGLSVGVRRLRVNVQNIDPGGGGRTATGLRRVIQSVST
jgi:hypothetical protein